MNAKFKAAYEAPAMQVVELQAKASLCGGSNRTIDWTYNQDQFNPDGEAGWGRPGYGDAVEF